MMTVGCGLGRYIVIFQVFDLHLLQRGVIVDESDMAAICEHELIFQFFLATKLWRLNLTFNRQFFAIFWQQMSELPSGPIEPSSPEVERHEPVAHFRPYQRARLDHLNFGHVPHHSESSSAADLDPRARRSGKVAPGTGNAGQSQLRPCERMCGHLAGSAFW